MPSYLKLSEKASTPYLERQYPPPVSESLPSILATFTTRPRAFFSRGRHFRVTSIRPKRFTSRTFLKSSSCIHSTGPMGTEMPALFTKPHRPDTRRHKTCSVHANHTMKRTVYSTGHSRWVCFFIRTDLEGLHQLLTVDPLQWMGAVRMRVQTADKNITIIHK